MDITVVIIESMRFRNEDEGGSVFKQGEEVGQGTSTVCQRHALMQKESQSEAERAFDCHILNPVKL